MKVCVYGLWHLGTVTAACLSQVGHDVVGLDPDDQVIKTLNHGKAPIFEPKLDELIIKQANEGRLQFTSDVVNACKDADILWVTFDTPVDENDVADVNFVVGQVNVAFSCLPDNALVLVSSQLPVGSILLLENLAKKNVPNKKLSFACLPENLRLGIAIDVFLRPDRIIVGVRSIEDRIKLEKLLHPLTDKIEWMLIESAEMTKHAINAFLATSITFANEIATICELVGADAKEVERGLKSESRIGPGAYLSPGGPFAGGTLARDIEFLGVIGKDLQLITPLISSVSISNDAHKKWVQRQLSKRFRKLAGLDVAIWGLTYKAGTDTLRRSLSIELIDWLLEQGAKIQVYDPCVKELPPEWGAKVKHSSSAIDNLLEVEVLVVNTDWPEFRKHANCLHKYVSSNLLIIDANRHLKENLKDSPFDYISVGSKQKD